MGKQREEKELEIDNLHLDIERIKSERDESLAILNEDLARIKMDYQV